jgi:hypothetical protein
LSAFIVGGCGHGWTFSPVVVLLATSPVARHIGVWATAVPPADMITNSRMVIEGHRGGISKDCGMSILLFTGGLDRKSLGL